MDDQVPGMSASEFLGGGPLDHWSGGTTSLLDGGRRRGWTMEGSMNMWFSGRVVID